MRISPHAIWEHLAIMQIPFLFVSRILFGSRCWERWAARAPGGSNRSREANPETLCGSRFFSPPRRQCCSSTVQALNTAPHLLLTQNRVCVRVCVRMRTGVFVCVYWGATERNLGVCSCHEEVSIFMTRGLLSGTSELLHTWASWLKTLKPVKMTNDNYCHSHLLCRGLFLTIIHVGKVLWALWKTSSHSKCYYAHVQTLKLPSTISQSIKASVLVPCLACHHPLPQTDQRTLTKLFSILHLSRGVASVLLSLQYIIKNPNASSPVGGRAKARQATGLANALPDTLLLFHIPPRSPWRWVDWATTFPVTSCSCHKPEVEILWIYFIF